MMMVVVGGDREASWVLTRLAGGLCDRNPSAFFFVVKLNPSVSELCFNVRSERGCPTWRCVVVVTARRPRLRHVTAVSGILDGEGELLWRRDELVSSGQTG